MSSVIERALDLVSRVCSRRTSFLVLSTLFVPCGGRLAGQGGCQVLAVCLERVDVSCIEYMCMLIFIPNNLELWD